MKASGSTLLFGAIPAHIKPSTDERRALKEFVRALEEKVTGKRAFVCLLADDAHLRELNSKFLGKDYATDVLSFPDGNELVEIAISMERAAAQAAKCGHTRVDEVRILMLHGVLHLTGLDHEKNSAMAKEEKRWRAEFQLPETLISRTRRQAAL